MRDIRFAGAVWFPPANQMGEGCNRGPEGYPPRVKPQMSHGPDLLHHQQIDRLQS